MTVDDSKSGARFERIVRNGEAFVLKHIDHRDDWHRTRHTTLRDLDRLDQPVHRGRAFQQLPVQRAGGDTGLQHGRSCKARRDRIDAHAGAAPFGGKRLCDLDDTGFRRRIGVDRA